MRTAEMAEFVEVHGALPWVVESAFFTREAKQYGPSRVWYCLHVRGRNLFSDGAPFAWTIKAPDAWELANRYDFSGAEMDAETRAVVYGQKGGS